MSFERDYWMQLHANLINACPVDTRNMVTHIALYETPSAYEIVIAAPYALNPKVKKQPQNGVGNYAGAVNFANRSPHKGWVEREIDYTNKIMNARTKYLGV